MKVVLRDLETHSPLVQFLARYLEKVGDIGAGGVESTLKFVGDECLKEFVGIGEVGFRSPEGIQDDDVMVISIDRRGAVSMRYRLNGEGYRDVVSFTLEETP